MKVKVYIAGKITGYPDYKTDFRKAEKSYKDRGYTVLSPAVLPAGMLPADYMRICFSMIDTSDVVVFLPNYKQSAGALLEHEYCQYIDKEIRYFENEETVGVPREGTVDLK